MGVVIGVFRGDSGFATILRNVVEPDGRVPALMRIGDFVQHAPMSIKDARRGRGGALIQRVERWQIDEQPRSDARRADEADDDQDEE